MKARWGSFHTLGIVAGAIGSLVVSLAAGAAQASTPAAYQLQPLVKLGDKVGGFTAGPSPSGGFLVVGLNDQGQILFHTFSDAAQSALLAEYTDGALVPVALPGQAGPGGKWPSHIGFWYPMNMNRRGSVAFHLGSGPSGASIGIFRWDADQRQTTPIALPGMPAVDGLTFMPGAVGGTAINDSNEVAFAQQVKDATGKALGQGAFFLGRDGVLHVVALPGQALADGETVGVAAIMSLNDAGVVGFIAGKTPTSPPAAYLWENGTITRIGPNIVGGGQIVGGGPGAGWGSYPVVNNHDATVLVAAKQTGSPQWGLYRWGAGQLTPVLQHGQALPGGGTFRDMDTGSVSLIRANDAGQYAFTCMLTEAGVTRRGAYRLDPDGTLSLILEEGMTTNRGTITRLEPAQSSGVGLNSQGQVALPVQIDNGVAQIVLLTPDAP